MKELYLDDMVGLMRPGIKIPLSAIKLMRQVRALKKKNYPVPLMAVWILTYKCNFRCSHCYIEGSPESQSEELPTRDAKQLISILADAGVRGLTFSGGEPLVREDFLELVGHVKASGMEPIIMTNGALLNTKILEDLKTLGIRRLGISLDGATEETYNRIRQTDGYDLIMSNLAEAQRLGLSILLCMTIQRDNFREVNNFIDLGLKFGVARVVLRDIIPYGRAMKNNDISPVEREELLKVYYKRSKDLRDVMEVTICDAAPWLRIMLELSKEEGAILDHMRIRLMGKFMRGCPAAALFCGVSPEGNLLPCPFLLISVGNILKEGFTELWHNSEVMKNIRNQDIKGKCKICEYMEVCGGCRARAYGYVGDYLAADPGCNYAPKKGKEK